MIKTINSNINLYLLGESVNSIGDRKYQFINGWLTDCCYGYDDKMHTYVSFHKIEIFTILMKINFAYNTSNFEEAMKDRISAMKYHNLLQI